MLIQTQKTVQFVCVCACVPEKYDERKGKLFIHSHIHTHALTYSHALRTQCDNGKQEAEEARNNFCIAYFLAKLFTYKCWWCWWKWKDDNDDNCDDEEEESRQPRTLRWADNTDKDVVTQPPGLPRHLKLLRGRTKNAFAVSFVLQILLLRK